VVEVEKRSALKVQTQSHHADLALAIVPEQTCVEGSVCSAKIVVTSYASAHGRIRFGLHNVVQMAFLTHFAAVGTADSALSSCCRTRWDEYDAVQEACQSCFVADDGSLAGMDGSVRHLAQDFLVAVARRLEFGKAYRPVAPAAAKEGTAVEAAGSPTRAVLGDAVEEFLAVPA